MGLWVVVEEEEEEEEQEEVVVVEVEEEVVEVEVEEVDQLAWSSSAPRSHGGSFPHTPKSSIPTW